ncbi:MAG TPA: Gfo/Idh/MocA family oxidoreductase [Verrucomicrobiae bacterium]|nr:Gfo/Idh/MocA family oxidoreductase [Verrucomicrobiae bacterium]
MSEAILIVGCGSIGERHLRCFQRAGQVEVTACDANPALLGRVAAQYGVAGFGDFHSALAARRYDGVVICTPAHTHMDLAIAALGHGAGVFVEKPLGTSLAKVNELREAAAKSGRFTAVAYVYHLMPWIRGARDFLRGGEMGRPLHASVVAGQHFPTFRPAYREIYYARHESGGGAIQDALTHVANAVEWLIGPTSRVFCDAGHQSLEGVTVEDTVNVTARNGGALVSYALNQFQAPNEMTLQIHCEGGSVRVEGHEQRWSAFRRGADGWEHHKAAPLERDDLFIAQARAFLDGLGGQPTALSTIDEAAQTLRFNLAALESARTGKAVEIP